MFFLWIFLFFNSTFSLIFWDNFQNSFSQLHLHKISRSDQNNILINENSFKLIPTNGVISYQSRTWGDRYVYQKGVPSCPLLSDGRCGVGYYYECNCGRCRGCDNCYGIAYCECVIFWSNFYEIIYLNKLIIATISPYQFQISFEVKGTGDLRVIALFPVESCSNNVLVRNTPFGLFASTDPIHQVVLTPNDFVFVSFLYNHNLLGCISKVDNQIMIGFNGAFELRNLVVNEFNNQELEYEGVLAGKIIYTPMKMIDPDKIIATVSFKKSDSFILKNLEHSYEGIYKIIGSSKGNSILKTFEPIKEVVALGSDNILECNVNGSVLIGGNQSTSFKINEVNGNCYIENFSIDNNDVLDLRNMEYYHNFSQISKFITNDCGDHCIKISFPNVSIYIKGVDNTLISIMTILFDNYPCFKKCPDCRLSSHCEFCIDCIDGLCDLEGCHVCVFPLFLYKKKCISNCTIGNYIDYKNRKCFDCGISYCLNCSQDLQCNNCSNNTFLYNYNCFETCPNRTYPNIDSIGRLICIDCPQNCSSCDENGCLVCDQGYVRFFNENKLFKCIRSECNNNERYNSDGQCQVIDLDLINIIKDSYNYNKRKNIENVAHEVLNQTYSNFTSDSFNYLLTDYEEKNEYICLDPLKVEEFSSCQCFNKTKNHHGLLRIFKIFKNILKVNYNISKLCTIFDINCSYSTNKIDKEFKNQISFDEEIFILNYPNFNSYNFNKIRYLFKKIRGNDNYYIIMNILNKTKYENLILQNWMLQFDENNNLLSFKNNEIFSLVDPNLYCNESSQAIIKLNFTYGQYDNYFIKSFTIFKKQNNENSFPILQNSLCREYIKFNERCRISNFENLFKRQVYRVNSWVSSFKKLQLNQQCALIDLFYEVGEFYIINLTDFKNYIEKMVFSYVFKSENDYYKKDWNNNFRIQQDLKILAGNVNLLNGRVTDCEYTVLNIENQRFCDLKEIDGLVQQLKTSLHLSNTSFFQKVNTTNFDNLIVKGNSNELIFENETFVAFTNILMTHNTSKFTVIHDLITLPEIYLIHKWQFICEDIIQINDLNEILMRLAGNRIIIENAIEIKDLMIAEGFEFNGENIFTFKKEKTDFLIAKNIMNFQNLWNCNNESNQIEIDGLISNNLWNEIRSLKHMGFDKICF